MFFFSLSQLNKILFDDLVELEDSRCKIWANFFFVIVHEFETKFSTLCGQEKCDHGLLEEFFLVL